MSDRAKLLDVKLCKWIGPTTLEVEFNPETFTGYEIAETHFFDALNNYESLKARVAELEEALQLLVDDVQDYDPWQRPCHAVDAARAALNEKDKTNGL